MTNEELKQMESNELVEALIEDTSLASDFDRLNLWDEFDSDDWVELLSEQPQFDNKCNKWERFDSFDWSDLLSAQPQFADKCPDKMYDQFIQADWDKLEAKHPGVFEGIHMLSTLRKLAGD